MSLISADSDLLTMQCDTSYSDTAAVDDAQRAIWLVQLPDWSIGCVSDIDCLEAAFGFANFVDALAFTCKVGELAEAENHHPALLTEWGKVRVQWWTHVVGGLHMNDFILAAKTSALYKDIGK